MAKRTKISLAEQLKLPQRRDLLMSQIRRDDFPTSVKQAAARNYATARGISYKSALRTIDRYTTVSAAQKRGTTRPNADIVQSFLDAQQEVAKGDKDYYEITVNPPDNMDIRTWENYEGHPTFEAAVAAANEAAAAHGGVGGDSDMKLWKCVACLSALMREETVDTLQGQVVFLTPTRSRYEMISTWYVERQ